MTQPLANIDLFLMTDAKNATFKVALPDGQVRTAKSDEHGGLHLDVKTIVTIPEGEFPRTALSSIIAHTHGFMTNVALDACILAAKVPRLPDDKLQTQLQRIIDIIGDELLTEREPIWDYVITQVRNTQPLLRQMQEKIVRNVNNNILRTAKAPSFKHTSVFMNFISHEFEFDIIPTAYTHNVSNGGDVVIRFAGFRGGDFCQLVFSNRRWITLVGNENHDEITLKEIYYNTRDQIERKIKLGDTGFMQHIAKVWTEAIFNGQPQPHRNIELIVYDLQSKHQQPDAKAIADADRRYKFMLQKLRMLFDENEPADTDRTWVRVMREVYFNMGHNEGHIVSGRFLRKTS